MTALRPWKFLARLSALTRRGFTGVFFVLGLTGPANATECLDYTANMHWVGGLSDIDVGDVEDLEVAYPHVFLVSDNGFYVIDVSDPATPGIEWFLPGGNLRCLTLDGSYAYIGGSDFFVYDMSDPTSPVQVGEAGNGGLDIAIEGSYAAIVSHSVLTILDISDPTEPETVTWINLGTACASIEMKGDILYIARGSWIDVYEASDKENPVHVRSVQMPGANLLVRSAGGVLYVSGYDHFSSLDLSDPLNPVLLDTHWATGYAVHRFVVEGSIAYVGAAGVRILDVSDPAEFVEINRYPSPTIALVDLEGAYLYGGGSGFNIVDTAGHNVATAVGELELEAAVYDVASIGEVAVLATYAGGIEVIDLSIPESPLSLANEPTAGFAWSVDLDVDVDGALAYVADGPGGLSIHDLSEPSTPEFVGSFDIEGLALDVRVVQDVAFLAAGNYGLTLVDVSEPGSPQLLGSLDTPGTARRVEPWADWVFVSGGSSGLHVVNVTDPYLPYLEVTVSGAIVDVAIAPPYAYVVDETVGLRILDISIPNAPSEVSALYLPRANTVWAPNGIEIDDGYAYIASDLNGLFVIDVVDPSSPRMLGHLDTEQALDLLFRGDDVLIADGEGGLVVAPVHCRAAEVSPDAPTRLAGSLRLNPNPVSESTILHWNVSRRGDYTLELFSASGRRVARLFRGELESGEWSRGWDELSVPRSLSSGRYYLRLVRGKVPVEAIPLVIR